jgi:hypothetical protein
MSPHHFRASLEAGKAAEALLDAHYAKSCSISPAPLAEDRAGVDRYFETPGGRVSVQYKCDWKAGETGNAFLELLSSVERGTLGWALTDGADWLVYLLPHADRALLLKRKAWAERIGAWAATCRLARVTNDGWHSVGLLVPLAEWEQLASRIDTLDCSAVRPLAPEARP